MHASRVPVDQVKQREQVNPDDVDEVPVKSADLDWSVPLRGEASLPRHDQKPEKDAQADDHVQRVQAGHHKVKREEQLRVMRIGVLAGMSGDRHVIETERSAGDVMLLKFFYVFNAFDAKEHDAEQHGDDETNNQQRAARSLRGPDGKDYRQTAADQYRGIGRAQAHVDRLAGRGEVSKIQAAVDQVRAEQAAEKHDFRGEEDPHAQAGGIPLLLRLGEVV